MEQNIYIFFEKINLSNEFHVGVIQNFIEENEGNEKNWCMSLPSIVLPLEEKKIFCNIKKITKTFVKNILTKLNIFKKVTYFFHGLK